MRIFFDKSIIEKFSKKYFRKGQNYFKPELTDILEVIILQNKPDQIYSVNNWPNPHPARK